MRHEQNTTTSRRFIRRELPDNIGLAQTGRVYDHRASNTTIPFTAHRRHRADLVVRNFHTPQ
jgi:hypothetical protein